MTSAWGTITCNDHGNGARHDGSGHAAKRASLIVAMLRQRRRPWQCFDDHGDEMCHDDVDDRNHAVRHNSLAAAMLQRFGGRSNASTTTVRTHVMPATMMAATLQGVLHWSWQCFDDVDGHHDNV